MSSISHSNIGVEKKIENLTETIKKSNKITNIQNIIMIVLTIIMALLTAVTFFR